MKNALAIIIPKDVASNLTIPVCVLFQGGYSYIYNDSITNNCYLHRDEMDTGARAASMSDLHLTHRSPARDAGPDHHRSLGDLRGTSPH